MPKGKKSVKTDDILFLKEQLKFAKEQIKALKEEKDHYKVQVDRLQNALLSIQAPTAYRDIQEEKLPPLEPVNKEAKEHQRKIAGVYQDYIRNLEAPLFKDAEDMEKILETVVLQNTNLSGKSIHGDSES